MLTSNGVPFVQIQLKAGPWPCLKLDYLGVGVVVGGVFPSSMPESAGESGLPGAALGSDFT